MLDRLIIFLKESKAELKKVSWPSYEETVRYTIVVVVISGAVALFLGAMDIVSRQLLGIFILR